MEPEKRENCARSLHISSHACWVRVVAQDHWMAVHPVCKLNRPMLGTLNHANTRSLPPSQQPFLGLDP